MMFLVGIGPAARRRLNLGTGLVTAAIAAAALTGCGSSGSKHAGSSSPPSASATTAAAADSGAASPAAKLVPGKFKSGVTVATSQGYPPTDFVASDGKITGFDYDLGQALAAKLGIPFKFQETTFAAIIPGILAGKFNLVMDDMDDTPDREKQLMFVDYFKAGYAIVVPEAQAGRIHGLSDLCGKTVAVTQGTTNATIAANASNACKKAGKPAISISQLATGADDLLALHSGKAVAQIDDTNTAGYSVLQSHGGLRLVPLSQIPSSVAGIGVPKADAALAKAIRVGLQELINGGTYHKLLAKYGLSHDAVASATIDKPTG